MVKIIENIPAISIVDNGFVVNIGFRDAIWNSMEDINKSLLEAKKEKNDIIGNIEALMKKNGLCKMDKYNQ